MNFFSRLSNIVSGFFSMFIKGVEEKNPEAVYEAAINERLKQHAELKKAISTVVYQRNKTQSEIEQIDKKLEEVEYQLEAALAGDEAELGTMLIEEQERLTKERATKEAELEALSNQAEQCKESLRSFQVEIENLKREKDTMIAKLKTAEAQAKVQAAFDKFSTEADTAALENIRESIEKKAGEVEATREMNADSLDSKMAKLQKEGTKLRAQQKFEEMRKKRAAREKGETEGSGVKKTI